MLYIEGMKTSIKLTSADRKNIPAGVEIVIEHDSNSASYSVKHPNPNKRKPLSKTYLLTDVFTVCDQAVSAWKRAEADYKEGR